MFLGMNPQVEGSKETKMFLKRSAFYILRNKKYNFFLE